MDLSQVKILIYRCWQPLEVVTVVGEVVEFSAIKQKKKKRRKLKLKIKKQSCREERNISIDALQQQILYMAGEIDVLKTRIIQIERGDAYV